MNLNTLIDQWIGEEDTHSNDCKIAYLQRTGSKKLLEDNINECTCGVKYQNKALQDLKSRKQELIDSIIAELEKCKDDENIWDYIYALKK